MLISLEAPAGAKNRKLERREIDFDALRRVIVGSLKNETGK